MLWPASKAVVREAIAKAIDAHNAFENAHRAQMETLLSAATWTCAKDKYRTVEIDEENWIIRPHGSYDMDQRVDRIAGEAARFLFMRKRRPPRALRAMVEAAL